MTRRELSSQEIIRAGQAQETRDAWEHARAFAWALYGSSALRLTYSQIVVPEGDHHMRLVQALALDATGGLVPYDFTGPWWAAHDLPAPLLTNAWKLTQDDLAHGLGSGFPAALGAALRAFAEERLGIETLHTWESQSEESETLTWTFDLAAPPTLPYAEIMTADAIPLSPTDIIAAGQEHASYRRWAGAQTYVRTLYGGRAAEVHVTTFSSYNDNTYDNSIKLGVFDADGTRLPYDLRLPWWGRFALSEQQIADYASDPQSAYTDVPEYDLLFDLACRLDMDVEALADIERLATDLLGVDFIQTLTPWDSDTVRYDLSRPPQQRFPRLWANEDAHERFDDSHRHSLSDDV